MKKSICFFFSALCLISAFKVYSQQSGKNIQGVCPPFFLYDEKGEKIDLIKNMNTDKPYSPKQTCGKCHDYNKITEGFHFQQGKNEKIPAYIGKKFNWILSPGNYGGNWCSPAPIYRQLAPKKNYSVRMIDMTSFEFITATCGYCHPGGGPLEYDREGNRYDEYMIKNKLVSGGDNNLDGDYYKAKWDKTGVLEADCMICHQPEYNFKERNTQIDKQNFRWASTAASGFGIVEGSIKDSIPVRVRYNLALFDADGKYSGHIVKEPRNDACLNCHAKPQWKKRGGNFSIRTDVHIKAGLKCIDCHTAGENASNEKIKGKEVHQFGKGDDPSGHVRNDLDNTVRDCKDCHITGYLNAPIAKHNWLPTMHLDRIACQTCHIPNRANKAALVQVSDVYNPGVKITPPAKHIWTFYDANMNYWNHYGELNMFTVNDKPISPYKPVLAKYKDKIYPVNQVHSAWVGLEEKGKDGLNQPFMKDIFMMWTLHNQDKSMYKELSKIKDDNRDGIPEVNSDEEIDAIINSVTKYLEDTKFDLKDKKVVWVNNDKIYYSSKEFKIFPKELYEASPFASVYKYSHDVMPAKAALGKNGCTDCHSYKSGFFTKEVLQYPFDGNGNQIKTAQFKLFDISPIIIHLSIIRESYLKVVFYGLLMILGALVISLLVNRFFRNIPLNGNTRRIVVFLIPAIFIIIFLIKLCVAEDFGDYLMPTRLALDSNHFLISFFVVLFSSLFLIYNGGKNNKTDNNLKEFIKNDKISFNIFVSIVMSIVFGMGMFFKISTIFYSLFEITLVILLILDNYAITKLLKNSK